MPNCFCQTVEHWQVTIQPCPCRWNTLYRHAYRPSLGPPAFPDIEKEVHYLRARSSVPYYGAINIRYSHPTEKRLRPNFCGTLSFLYPIHFPMFSGKRSKNPFRPSFLPFLSPCHFLRFLQDILGYRDSLKGLYVVGRIFFLLLLNCSPWP